MNPTGTYITIDLARDPIALTESPMEASKGDGCRAHSSGNTTRDPARDPRNPTHNLTIDPTHSLTMEPTDPTDPTLNLTTDLTAPTIPTGPRKDPAAATAATPASTARQNGRTNSATKPDGGTARYGISMNARQVPRGDKKATGGTRRRNGAWKTKGGGGGGSTKCRELGRRICG
jgi:hypothetical protein